MTELPHRNGNNTERVSVRWGIIGAGDASTRFAEGLKHVEGATVDAVWTRRSAGGETFAANFGGRVAQTLDDLLTSAIDAVYIGTHPDSHFGFSLAALRAGRHVLCEKPSMLNEQELDVVLREAVRRRLLFMEAMKPPFFPLYQQLRRHLENDPIGQVGYVRAGSSLADIPRSHALWDAGRGGGSLLGIAPYEAFLALDWLGPVESIQTLGRLDDDGSLRGRSSGVDTWASLQTRHEHGFSQLYCGLGLHGHGDALLAGPLGNVAIPAKWWNPAAATIRYLDGRTIEMNEPIVSSGFNYETQHFCELLRDGKRESPVMTHSMSRQMMRILDRARDTLGLVYPQEMSAQNR